MVALGATALMLASPNFSCKGPLTGADMGNPRKVEEPIVKERRPTDVHAVPVKQPTETTDGGYGKLKGGFLKPDIKKEPLMH